MTYPDESPMVKMSRHRVILGSFVLDFQNIRTTEPCTQWQYTTEMYTWAMSFTWRFSLSLSFYQGVKWEAVFLSFWGGNNEED